MLGGWGWGYRKRDHPAGCLLTCPFRAFSVPLGQGHCFHSGAWHGSFLEQHPGWLHNPLLTRPASGSNCLASEVTRHLPPISPVENRMTLKKKKKVMGHLLSQNGLAKLSLLEACLHFPPSSFHSRGFSIPSSEPTEVNSRLERCSFPPPYEMASVTCPPHILHHPRIEPRDQQLPEPRKKREA